MIWAVVADSERRTWTGTEKEENDGASERAPLLAVLAKP